MICFSELVIFLRWAIPGAFFRFWNRCGQHKCTVQDDFVYYFLQKSPTVVWPVEMPVFFLSIILPSTQSTHNSSSLCLIPELPSIDLFLRCSFSVQINISLSCIWKIPVYQQVIGFFFLSVSVPLSATSAEFFHLGVLYISTFLYTNDRFFIYFSWYWTFICQTNVIDWGLLVLSETECETLHVLKCKFTPKNRVSWFSIEMSVNKVVICISLLNESQSQDFTSLLFVLTEFPQGYPNIIINPELKSVEKEKPTVMQCKADANGHKFEIEWFKNNVPVELGDNRRLTITDTGICLTKSGSL